MKSPLPEPLNPADHAQAIHLFQRTPSQHLHLDWRTLPQWLAHPALRCWVLRPNGTPQTLLGATLHHAPGESPAKIAWLRMALPIPSRGEAPELDRLWEQLLIDLREEAIEQIAVLVANPWLEDILTSWGFACNNKVVSLRRKNGLIPDPPDPPLRIREITRGELGLAAKVDAAAFGLMWRYNLETLQYAFAQAATTTVIETGDQVWGYQLSTEYAHSAHLARLAVIPEKQGAGMGALLLGAMLRFFRGRNVHTITVNTQADNIRSLRLYRKLGFEPVDQGIPVWIKAVTP